MYYPHGYLIPSVIVDIEQHVNSHQNFGGYISNRALPKHTLSVDLLSILLYRSVPILKEYIEIIQAWERIEKTKKHNLITLHGSHTVFRILRESLELQVSQGIRRFPGIKMSSKTHLYAKSMKLISEETVAGFSEQCHLWYPDLRVQNRNVFQSWDEKCH